MAQEEIKQQPKEFVPPVEHPSLNGDTIADICEYIVTIERGARLKSHKELAAKLIKAADSLNMDEAHRIDCSDVLVRMRRNALALSNQLAITQMVIENIQSNIRDIITARDAEHQRYEVYVAKLYKAWKEQQKYKAKQDNQED